MSKNFGHGQSPILSSSFLDINRDLFFRTSHFTNLMSHQDFCCEIRTDECARQFNSSTDCVRRWHWSVFFLTLTSVLRWRWCTFLCDPSSPHYSVVCPQKTDEFPENPAFFRPFLWHKEVMVESGGNSKIILDFYPVICLVRWIMVRLKKVGREVVKTLDYQW
jgi:hypothetical protein